jgi:hypothetical protein
VYMCESRQGITPKGRFSNLILIVFNLITYKLIEGV